MIGGPVRPRPARAQLAVARGVVLALEVDLPSRSSARMIVKRFLEAADAVVERVAEGAVLRLVPAGAEAEDQRGRR